MVEPSEGRLGDMIRLDARPFSQPPKLTDDGFLDIWAVAAHVGTLKYGDREEEVTVDALVDSAPTLKDAPVIELHPKNKTGRVDAANARDLTVGHVAEVHVEDGEQHVRLRIFDEDAIRRVLVERLYAGVSPGYDVTESELGDGKLIQKGRKVNHLALVPNPRGDRANLRLDGEEPMEEEKNEGKPQFDGEDYMKRLDAMCERMDAMMKRMDALMKPDDVEDGEEDDTQRADSADDFLDRFEAHKRALDTAAKLGVEVKDRADTETIRRAVVAHVGSSRSDASDEYIAGVFDAIASTQATTPTPEAPAPLFDPFGYGHRAPAQRADSAADDVFVHPSTFQ